MTLKMEKVFFRAHREWSKTLEISSERQLSSGKNLVDVKGQKSERADWLETSRKNNNTKSITHCFQPASSEKYL